MGHMAVRFRSCPRFIPKTWKFRAMLSPAELYTDPIMFWFTR
jgi:hypothetical protein